MERQKEYIYARGYWGAAKANELLKFVRTNPGARKLLPSMIEKCDHHVNKAGIRIYESVGISERLMRLRSLIDKKFKDCVIHETLTRKLEAGIGITLALPEGYANIRQLNKVRLIPSVRLDLAWQAESPYSQDPLKTYIKSGTQLLAAVGLTEVDRWGNIIGEDLDGVRLFLDDLGWCFGSEIKFNGPGLNTPSKIITFNFNDSHQTEINQLKDRLSQLSFLPHLSPVGANFNFSNYRHRKF